MGREYTLGGNFYILLFIASGYCLASYFTTPIFWGDSGYYVLTVLDAQSISDPKLWEFGHLLWRPLGYLAISIHEAYLSPVQGNSLTDPRQWLTEFFAWISWIAGLGSVLVFAILTSNRSAEHSTYESSKTRVWRFSPIAFSCFFAFSWPFLNYSQTACPYIPGLFFLLCGSAIIGGIKNAKNHRGGLSGLAIAGAALSFSLALGMWSVYVLAVPGFVLLGLYQEDRKHLWQIRNSLIAACVCFLFLLTAIYGCGAWFAQVNSLSEVKSWVRNAGHGKENHGGIARSVFGAINTFIDLGDIGKDIKRYALNDPYNPITLWQAFGLGATKILAFLTFVASILLCGFIQPPNRALLAVFLVAFLPNMAFAISFDGSSPERFLNSYPILLLLGVAVTTGPTHRVVTSIVGLFLLIATVNNLPQFLTYNVRAQEEHLVSVAKDLQTMVRAPDSVFVPTCADKLCELNRGFYYEPNMWIGSLGTGVIDVVSVGNISSKRWRENFESRVKATRERGGNIWFSSKLRAPKPHRNWGWVEGEDKNVRWNELQAYFQLLEADCSLGGGAWCLLLPSALSNL